MKNKTWFITGISSGFGHAMTEQLLESGHTVIGTVRSTEKVQELIDKYPDTIFVETVGVGQSETAVHSMVDFFLLIQLAGTGDELQGIKRGIMEMADGIVINKADGDNIDRARLAQAQFTNALHLFPATESGWQPKVLCYSGYYGLGIDEVWQMIDEYFDFVRQNGYFDLRRSRQARYWMYESINEQLRANFYRNPAVKEMLKQKEAAVLANQASSFVAASDVVSSYFANLRNS